MSLKKLKTYWDAENYNFKESFLPVFFLSAVSSTPPNCTDDAAQVTKEQLNKLTSCTVNQHTDEILSRVDMDSHRACAAVVSVLLEDRGPRVNLLTACLTKSLVDKCVWMQWYISQFENQLAPSVAMALHRQSLVPTKLFESNYCSRLQFDAAMMMNPNDVKLMNSAEPLHFLHKNFLTQMNTMPVGKNKYDLLNTCDHISSLLKK